MPSLTALHSDLHVCITVTGLQATLHKTEEAMERLMREEGGRVDQYVHTVLGAVYPLLQWLCLHRNLVKNLVVGYVQASDRKKPEVLNLIAKILDFAPAELEQVYTRTCVVVAHTHVPTRPSPTHTFPPQPHPPPTQVQGHKGSWLRSFWSRATTPSPTSPKVSIQVHMPLPLSTVHSGTPVYTHNSVHETMPILVGGLY